jgi:type I restriction enzyme, S subunit
VIESTWPVELLGDLAAPEDGAIAIGPFGSSMKADVYVDEGVPLVRGTNLDGLPGFRGNFVFVDETTAARFGRCIISPGDLVFPHRGAIGSVGLAVDAPPGKWLMSTSMMKFRPNGERLDPLFAFHFFRSELGTHELLKNASQVGTPGIAQPLASLRTCEIPVPPIEVQRAIAGVLGALDDKIEHNKQTSRALERLARTVFRAWFVDFEPVKTKSAGAVTFPSMPSEVFDMLPTSMVDSDIGRVPDGWQVKPATEVADVGIGKTPPPQGAQVVLDEPVGSALGIH